MLSCWLGILCRHLGIFLGCNEGIQGFLLTQRQRHLLLAYQLLFCYCYQCLTGNNVRKERFALAGLRGHSPSWQGRHSSWWPHGDGNLVAVACFMLPTKGQRAEPQSYPSSYVADSCTSAIIRSFHNLQNSPTC